jgi:hypothetical protein
VARRRTAQRPAGGGGGIQAFRKARARVTLATLSVLAYAGVLAYAASRVPTYAGLVAAIGVLGAVLLAFVLARCALEPLPWALLLLGTAYAISLFGHGSGVDEGAPLVAAGALLCGELAAWSIAERQAIAAEPAVVERRAVAVGALVLAGLAVAAIVLALAAAPVGVGLAWTVAGAVAAVLVVGLAAWVGRRRAPLH